VAVSVDPALLQGTAEDRYRALRSMVQLEDGLIAVIDRAIKLP
jgi:hypothetical protein